MSSLPLRSGMISFQNDDDYETTESIWECIIPFVSFDKIIYEPFYCSGRSKEILNGLGYDNVIHEDEDFFINHQRHTYDIVISNPPFSKKKKVFDMLREIDVYDFKRYENDALGRLEIRKKYRELINLGFKDVYRLKNKTKQEYTFWDYFAGSWQKNYGMRIDHFLLSNSLVENVKSININKKPRSKEKPSDHTPIELEII